MNSSQRQYVKSSRKSSKYGSPPGNSNIARNSFAEKVKLNKSVTFQKGPIAQGNLSILLQKQAFSNFDYLEPSTGSRRRNTSKQAQMSPSRLSIHKYRSSMTMRGGKSKKPQLRKRGDSRIITTDDSDLRRPHRISTDGGNMMSQFLFGADLNIKQNKKGG